MPLITHPSGESNHNLIYGVVPAHGTNGTQVVAVSGRGHFRLAGLRLMRLCEFSEKGGWFQEGEKDFRVTISFSPRLCLHPLPAIDRSTMFDLL